MVDGTGRIFLYAAVFFILTQGKLIDIVCSLLWGGMNCKGKTEGLSEIKPISVIVSLLLSLHIYLIFQRRHIVPEYVFI